jgi:hypothetical protein
MLKMEIESFINGFSVIVYDNKDGYLVREVTETNLEALKVLQTALIKLLSKELDRLLNAATMQ